MNWKDSKELIQLIRNSGFDWDQIELMCDELQKIEEKKLERDAQK